MTILSANYIDSKELTGSLDVYVNGVVETAYSFDKGEFTLTERLNIVTLSTEDYFRNVKFISDWYCDLNNVLLISPSSNKSCNQKRSVVLEDISVTVKLGFNLDSYLMAIDGLYVKQSSNNVIFQPRPELVLNVTQFSYFLDTLKLFETKIKEVE